MSKPAEKTSVILGRIDLTAEPSRQGYYRVTCTATWGDERAALTKTFEVSWAQPEDAIEFFVKDLLFWGERSGPKPW